MVLDQTQLRLKTFLTQVRSKRLWPDPIAVEFAYDQTKMRSKRLWSDPSALESAYDQTFQTKSTSDPTISRPPSRL